MFKDKRLAYHQSDVLGMKVASILNFARYAQQYSDL